MLEREVKVGGIYKHFKGSYYKVICVAKDSEDLSLKVVYAHEDSDKIWVRDKNEFLSEVDRKKHPDVNQKYRFELVNEKIN